MSEQHPSKPVVTIEEYHQVLKREQPDLELVTVDANVLQVDLSPLTEGPIVVGDDVSEFRYGLAFSQLKGIIKDASDSGQAITEILATSVFLPADDAPDDGRTVLLERLAQDLGLPVVVAHDYPPEDDMPGDRVFKTYDPPTAETVDAYWERWNFGYDTLRTVDLERGPVGQELLHNALRRLQSVRGNALTLAAVSPHALHMLAAGSVEYLRTELAEGGSYRELVPLIREWAKNEDPNQLNSFGDARTVLAKIGDPGCITLLQAELVRSKAVYDEPGLMLPLGVVMRQNPEYVTSAIAEIDRIAASAVATQEDIYKLQGLMGALRYSYDPRVAPLFLKYIDGSVLHQPAASPARTALAASLYWLPNFAESYVAGQSEQEQLTLGADMRQAYLGLLDSLGTCTIPGPYSEREALLSLSYRSNSAYMQQFGKQGQKDSEQQRILRTHMLRLHELTGSVITHPAFMIHYNLYRGVHGDIGEISDKIKLQPRR